MAKALFKLFAKALTISLILLHLALIVIGGTGIVAVYLGHDGTMFAQMYSDTCIAIGVNLGVWAANKHFNGDA
jgi:TRAP-type C4-dicarboxylate transport system permease small subunit